MERSKSEAVYDLGAQRHAGLDRRERHAAFPASVVSDADLADIRTYLATLPAAPPVDEIPCSRRSDYM